MASSSYFTKTVVQAMRELYPEALADKSFDNTGLLLEAPQRPDRSQKKSVLLTIDLTREVANEAIERQDSIIVAYHPIIFRPLKALTLGNSQQESLLRLAQEGISVYCPHTAVDAAPGGLNDWLADIVVDKIGSKSGPIEHERRTITTIEQFQGFDEAGMGKIVKFKEPQSVDALIDRVGKGVFTSSSERHLNVAKPPTAKSSDTVSSVGICAGSGGSLLREIEVDVLLTGELSHHEALAATQNGQYVIATFHSRSERNFLSRVLRHQLKARILSRLEFAGQVSTVGAYAVETAQHDRDPYEIHTCH